MARPLSQALALCLALPALTAVAGLAAQENLSLPGGGPAVYVVQLDGVPLARTLAKGAGGWRGLAAASAGSRALLAGLQARQDGALAAIARALGRPVEPRHRYAAAFHGLALALSAEEAVTVSHLPGVLRVARSERLRTASDTGPAWTGAPGLWDGSATGGLPGTQGEGIVIGIVDTGIALGHPSFADVGGDGYDHVNPRGAGHYLGGCDPANPDYDPTLACNDKLIGVWNFTSDPGGPRDANGHGTHVASVAAGNHLTITVPGTNIVRQISGVAPHANLVAYDVCGFPFSCSSDAVLAAVDQAVMDGVDVLNVSIFLDDFPAPWQDPLSLALLEARTAGILVTTAQSNRGIGPEGYAPWVLGVAVTSHDRRFVTSLADLSGSPAPPPDMPGYGLALPYGPAAIVDANAYGNGECGPFPAGTFSGEIVLCTPLFSIDGDAVWAANVKAGGGGAMIFGQIFSDALADPEVNPTVLPSMRLSFAQTEQLRIWLGTGSSHSGRITGTTVELDPAHGDRLLLFGDLFSLQDVLKPDLAAPGRNVLAAYADAAGYAVLSGSSMAAAHAAGAAALIAALHPGWTPAEIQSALQTTAKPDVVRKDDGTPATASDVGSGRIDLSAAGRAGLVLPVAAADYQAADPGTGGEPSTLNLASLKEDRCLLTCSWSRTVRSTLSTTSHWMVAVEPPPGASLSVVPSSFTLAPGASQAFEVTATGPLGLNGRGEGRIVLTEAGAQAPPARLPVVVGWVPHYLLTVQRSGTGSGRVTSSPAGIDCGDDCSEFYLYSQGVTLTAAADPGSVFVGWGGGCPGVVDPTCGYFYGFFPPPIIAYFNPPSPDRALTNQVPLADAIEGPVSRGTWNYYYAEVESGTGELVVDLTGLGGTAGLYVRHGEKPTLAAADCFEIEPDRPFVDLPNRRCVIANPAAGRWWIGVNNREANRAIPYSVRAGWGAVSGVALANRSRRADLISSPEAGGGWKYYYADLPAGSEDLIAELTDVSADALLYLRFGAKPDRSHFDCTWSSGNLPCEVASPAAGRWWIGVNNLAAGTVTYGVRASWTAPDVATNFYTLTPCRLVDTRQPGQQPLVSGVARILQAAGSCGVPTTARALSANVTVVGATGAGHLVLHPSDEPAPETSGINFGRGQTRANNAILGLAQGGLGTLTAEGQVQNAGQVHLILDVNGYFE